MMFDFSPPLAVVPILVNAGAAVMPALIAGAASFAALLFKPRELIGACRRYPGRAAGVLASIAGLTALIVFWPATETPSIIATRARPTESTTDWTKVALELIREEQRQKSSPVATSVTPAATTPAPVAATTTSAATNFRGGFDRTGHAGGPAPLELRALWEYEEEFAMFLSAPVVHGGRVFAAWCLLDPPKTFGAIVCLDATTGRKLWQVEERNDKQPFKGIFSSPAVSADGRSVVIGQGLHPDSNCDLICLDAQTGRIKWLVPTPLHLESSPAIVGNLVVIGAGAIEVGNDYRVSGHPGYVFAVDLETGREVWRHDVADPESSPAIVGDVAYIGSGFNGSAIVALRTGSDDALKAAGQKRELWRRATPHPATGAITVTGDLLLAGCGNGDFVNAAKVPAGAVLALDRATGAVRWTVALPDAVLGPIAVRGSLAICPVRNGEVVALDLTKNGAIVWRQRIAGTSPILGGPAVTEELVYAASADGYLGVLSLADGALLEKHYLNAKSRPGSLGMSLSAPFVSGGLVFVGSETGGLRAYTGAKSRR
ncbi:MAG: PQQ-binding-like beta-propeller repeat protein [Opitutaceae bacterium]|nr:PQQ-binding-like beta-propeller repeat protein [Opitutaceae bacterium]